MPRLQHTHRRRNILEHSLAGRGHLIGFCWKRRFLSTFKHAPNMNIEFLARLILMTRVSAHFIDKKTEAATPGSQISGALLFHFWEMMIKRICKVTATGRTVQWRTLNSGCVLSLKRKPRQGTHLMIFFSDTARVGQKVRRQGQLFLPPTAPAVRPDHPNSFCGYSYFLLKIHFWIVTICILTFIGVKVNTVKT